MDYILYQISTTILNVSYKHEEKTNNPSVKIYINKTENRITYRIKTRYYLELLTTETMRLLGITKSKTTKNKNGKNMLHSEIAEVVLVACDIVNNDYQQDSRVMHSFIPNKSFGQLLDISPKNVVFLWTFDSEFSYIKVWFTDQNYKPVEIT